MICFNSSNLWTNQNVGGVLCKIAKEIAAEIGVSKQAVFKKMKRELLSTGL